MGDPLDSLEWKCGKSRVALCLATSYSPTQWRKRRRLWRRERRMRMRRKRLKRHGKTQRRKQKTRTRKMMMMLMMRKREKMNYNLVEIWTEKERDLHRFGC